MDDVEARVERLVLEYAEVRPKGELKQSASLRNDLGVSSLSLVSVAVALGDEFGVDLVEWGADLSKISTLGDLVRLARELAKAAKSR